MNAPGANISDAAEAGAHALAQHGNAHESAHELPNFIAILDERFPGSAFLHFLHAWDTIFFSLAAAAAVCLVAWLAVRKQTLVPLGLQNFAETLVEGISGFVTGILGKHGREHAPFLGTLFVYILLMNWSGLVPFMKSPTSRWSVTLALALFTTAYVQVTGIRAQGWMHYLKHLAGNPQNLMGLAMIPLMLGLNLILEIGAVPFSLSLRLFANISSEDRLLMNFAELAVTSKFLSFPLQLFANILAIIFSLVQAFVFMLLSTVYISLVLPHEETDHDRGPEHAGAEPQPSAVKGE